MLFALLATTLLAACTQDELAERGHTLPEGQYPLELTSASLGAMAIPTTRGTVDGTWNGGEIICVQVASSLDYADKDNIPWEQVPVINYTVSQDGTMKLVDASSIVYWQSTNETKYIRAWRAGTSGYNGVPVSSAETVKIGNWATNTVQSATTMAANDFLYAYKELTFAGKAESGIQLRHLLSKFTINLVRTSYLEAHAQNEVSVSLSCSEASSWNVEGKFKGYGADFELYEGFNLWSADITPYKLSTPASSTYYATYEALVIPQTTNIGNKVIKIKVGEATYTWAVKLPDNVYMYNVRGGQAYTFNITVKEQGLEVTVDNSIPWGAGGSGSGSVTIVEPVDLTAYPSEVYTVAQDETAIIDGKGVELGKRIVINDGAKVTLKNVKLSQQNTSANAQMPVIKVLGTAVLTFSGQDNVIKSCQSDVCSAILVSGTNATLTINGTPESKVTLDASSSANGIGIGATNNANLIINGGTIIATGGWDAAAIGSNHNMNCGNITINGGNITANAGKNAAAIGGGANAGICGNITITGGEIIANGNNEELGGVAIGSGTGTQSVRPECGNIIISGGNVTAKGGGGQYGGAGIGAGPNSGKCGSITITGGKVTAIGKSGTSQKDGFYDSGAGIGASGLAECQNITISGTNTIVIATAGGDKSDDIGCGYSSNYGKEFSWCGGVEMDSEANVTATNGRIYGH